MGNFISTASLVLTLKPASGRCSLRCAIVATAPVWSHRRLRLRRRRPQRHQPNEQRREVQPRHQLVVWHRRDVLQHQEQLRHCEPEANMDMQCIYTDWVFVKSLRTSCLCDWFKRHGRHLTRHDDRWCSGRSGWLDLGNFVAETRSEVLGGEFIRCSWLLAEVAAAVRLLSARICVDCGHKRQLLWTRTSRTLTGTVGVGCWAVVARLPMS